MSLPVEYVCGIQVKNTFITESEDDGDTAWDACSAPGRLETVESSDSDPDTPPINTMPVYEAYVHNPGSLAGSCAMRLLILLGISPHGI